MSTIHLERLTQDPFDCSVAADVLLREEPDEEDGEEGDREEDDDYDDKEEDDEGYSE